MPLRRLGEESRAFCEANERMYKRAPKVGTNGARLSLSRALTVLEVELRLEIEEVDIVIRAGLPDEVAGEKVGITSFHVEMLVELVVRHKVHFRTHLFRSARRAFAHYGTTCVIECVGGFRAPEEMALGFERELVFSGFNRSSRMQIDNVLATDEVDVSKVGVTEWEELVKRSHIATGRVVAAGVIKSEPQTGRYWCRLDGVASFGRKHPGTHVARAHLSELVGAFHFVIEVVQFAENPSRRWYSAPLHRSCR